MRGKGTSVHITFAFLLLCAGCGPGKPVVREIGIDVERGSNNPVLVIRNRDTGASYQDCNVSIAVVMEDGNSIKFDRVWSFWDEPKKIDLPKGAKVERVELIGSGLRVIKNQGQAVDFHYMERYR